MDPNPNELPPEQRLAMEGQYSNFLSINHSPMEFVLDFGRVTPGTEGARVHTRIVTSPQHAKAMLFALWENLQIYETNHGKLNFPDERPDIRSYFNKYQN